MSVPGAAPGIGRLCVGRSRQWLVMLRFNAISHTHPTCPNRAAQCWTCKGLLYVFCALLQAMHTCLFKALPWQNKGYHFLGTKDDSNLSLAKLRSGYNCVSCAPAMAFNAKLTETESSKSLGLPHMTSPRFCTRGWCISTRQILPPCAAFAMQRKRNVDLTPKFRPEMLQNLLAAKCSN